MSQSYLPYIFTEIYCIIFAVTIWLHLNSNMGSEHEINELRNMIYSYIAMLATDILWALNEDGSICPPHFLNAFINSVTIIAVSCGCYFWCRFIEDRLHFRLSAGKKLDRLLMLPLLAICVLDLASIFTGWLFCIDAQGHYQSSSLFGIQTTVNYFYLLIPTGYSVYRAVKTRSKQDRGEYLTYSLYMIAPLISGLLEDTFPHVPLLALNIFMMILILFVMIQNMQVYYDALTGLNNRRRLNQYLEDRISKSAPEHPTLLFIMDINSFKAINDTYGHLEGDRALKAVAGLLKDAAAGFNAFAARYGGDEFCMAADAAGHTPAEIEAELRRSLCRAIEPAEGGEPYALSVSIGCALCDNANDTPELVLAKADKLLYADKKKWHASGK